MDAFIYSLNSTVPIFLTMIVGWLIKRLGIINDEFANKANKYVFKVALPLLLYTWQNRTFIALLMENLSFIVP